MRETRLQRLIARVKEWPKEAQEKLFEAALEIETEWVRAAIARGLGGGEEGEEA